MTPISTGLHQKQQTVEGFKLCDYDNASDPVLYAGSVDSIGNWIIEEIDKTSGVVIRYATSKNNSDKANYAAAWTDRATLMYDLYSSNLF